MTAHITEVTMPLNKLILQKISSLHALQQAAIYIQPHGFIYGGIYVHTRTHDFKLQVSTFLSLHYIGVVAEPGPLSFLTHAFN